VVKAAARNWSNGKEVMTLLLDRRGDQITITEEAVRAAATCGQDPILDFLSQQTGRISLKESRRIPLSCRVADGGVMIDIALSNGL
jgi:hypothetical protein